jgi:hypothetical protein
MRESKLAEEDDWIAKNRRHLKKHGVFGKNATAGDVISVSKIAMIQSALESSAVPLLLSIFTDVFFASTYYSKQA